MSNLTPPNLPQSLSKPAKMLLLASLLAKDRIISNNGKAFLKDIILSNEEHLNLLLESFEKMDSNSSLFLEKIHNIISMKTSMMFDDLFIDSSLEVGKSLSKYDRERLNLSSNKSLIYGEVEFDSFYRVLRKISPPPGGVFYDLGSGTGKAVMVARLTQDFERCEGIEILKSLHEQGAKIVDRYNKYFKNKLCLGQKQEAKVTEGSLLEFDWSDGDVVFANSTCFDDDLMRQLGEQAERLKPGSIVVTFTKGINNKYFELLERKPYKMSWGPATVYIHRRLNNDLTSVGNFTLNTLPSDNDPSISPDYYPSYRISQNDDDEEEDEDEDEEDEGEEEDEDNADLSDLDVYSNIHTLADSEEDDKEEDKENDEEEEKEELLEASEVFNDPTATFTSPLKPEQPSPTNLESASPSNNLGFESLYSPQDAALLMRKRAPKIDLSTDDEGKN